MIFWSICAFLLTCSITFILRPLLRDAELHTDYKDTEVSIYRDQLQEISRDLERNLINSEEAESAKLEISRRLLTADEACMTQSILTQSFTPLTKFHKYLATAIAVVILISTLGIYFLLGTPGLPSKPYVVQSNADLTQTSVAKLIAGVENRLLEEPGDARGWDVIAPVYLRQKKYAKASFAFQQAIRLNGESIKRLTQYAEAVMGLSNGIVTDEVVAILERIITLQSDNIIAHFWLAVSNEQRKRTSQAIYGFSKLLTQKNLSPEIRHLIIARITALRIRILAVMLGIDVSDENALSSQDIFQRIASLSTKEQGKKIEYLVNDFWTKLKRNGGNISEWQRLIHTLYDLGKKKEATQAYSNALREFRGKPLQIEMLKKVNTKLKLD
ncbi:MAG: hypothetical protein TECD_00760 [Hyphomicrobiaceae bacterium hypho_1]